MSSRRFFYLLLPLLGIANLSDASRSSLLAQLSNSQIENYPTVQQPAPLPAPPPENAPPPVIDNIPTSRIPGNNPSLPLTPSDLKRLHDDQLTLQPTYPAPTTPTQPPPRAGYNDYSTFPSPPTFSNTQQSPIQSGPGGISLSKAAAERMPLNLSLEGAYLTGDGRLVFSGRASSNGIDAALLMTAMRAACEGEDLYFSLDPDEGAAWSREGQEASNAFWQQIKSNFKLGLSRNDTRRKANILNITTVSARRDYPQIWAALSPRYPNLRSRLVFRPEWLSLTRLGEILYKADVLLKELSYGVPLLEGGPLRARAVAAYTPEGDREVATLLLESLRNHSQAVSPDWRGSRLWFDLVPEHTTQPTCAVTGACSFASRVAELEPTTAILARQNGRGSKADELQDLLLSRGLLKTAPGVPMPEVTADAGALDLTHVYPRMFVRRHDQATGQDLPGHDSNLDGLARSVNAQIDDYVSAYRELRTLSDVFRAYVAAVKLAPQMAPACRRLSDLPMLDQEKLSTPLPQYHPSELFITVGSFEYTDDRTRRLQVAQASGISGGVSIGAQEFLSANLRNGSTPTTRSLLRSLARGAPSTSTWVLDDRTFVSFDLDENLRRPPPTGRADKPIRLANNDTARSEGPRYYPIENEPPVAQPSSQSSNDPRDKGRLAVVMLAVTFIAVLLGRPLFRSRRKT